MKIVLLSGFAGAGKDTFAEVLCQHKGYRRFAFADPIKEMVADQLGIPVQILHDPEGKKQIVHKNWYWFHETLPNEHRVGNICKSFCLPELFCTRNNRWDCGYTDYIVPASCNMGNKDWDRKWWHVDFWRDGWQLKKPPLLLVPVSICCKCIEARYRWCFHLRQIW